MENLKFNVSNEFMYIVEIIGWSNNEWNVMMLFRTEEEAKRSVDGYTPKTYRIKKLRISEYRARK